MIHKYAGIEFDDGQKIRLGVRYINRTFPTFLHFYCSIFPETFLTT